MAEQIQVKGIISYPHLFEPRSVKPGDAPKFSVNCLIHKSDPQVGTIMQAIETEKRNAFPSGFPANGKICLVQCKDQPDYWELRTNTNTNNPPHIVHVPGAAPVTDRSKVFAGAIAWFIVSISSYNDQFNKGVGGYINGVGITGDIGPLGRLDGKPSAEVMFAGVGGGASPTPAPPSAPSAPAYAAAPPAPGMAPAAPAPPAPPAPPAQSAYQMTAKANGMTREQFTGWTDEQLIANGYMLPPGGVPTVF